MNAPLAAEAWHQTWSACIDMFPNSAPEVSPPKRARVDDDDQVVVVDEPAVGVADVVADAPFPPEVPLPAVERTFEYPSWLTFDRDIEAWRDFLVSIGADEDSIMDLICLSQFSDDGYERANSTIGKILKKRSDQQEIRNISGFIHSNVLNARHEMQHLQDRHSGWSWSKSSDDSWSKSGDWWGSSDWWSKSSHRRW